MTTSKKLSSLKSKKVEGARFALCVSFAINHFFYKDGRSLRKVADGQKFSISTLSLALAGKREIMVSTLQEISQALGVTPQEIISYAQNVFDDIDVFNRIKALYEKEMALKTEIRGIKKGIASL